MHRSFTTDRGSARRLPPSSSDRAERRGSWLPFAACVLWGCTLTADSFEPSFVEASELEPGGSLDGTGPAASPGSEADLAPGAGESGDGAGAGSPSETPSDGSEGAEPAGGTEGEVGGSAEGEPGDTLPIEDGTSEAPDVDLELGGTSGGDDTSGASGSGDEASSATGSGEPGSGEPSSGEPGSANGSDEASSANGTQGQPEPPFFFPPPPPPPPPAPEPCPGPTFGGSCYQVFNEFLSWDLAEQRCVGWGGHLATIESSEEDAFLDGWPEELGIEVSDVSSVWLGGTDVARDGDFRWIGDRTLPFIGWAPGQPDNGVGGDCIEKRNDAAGQWYDRRCVDYLRFVCERPF